MKYLYKCVNKECTKYLHSVVVDKPMAESSKVEHCKICSTVLTRDYKLGGITTGDGTK